MKFLLSIFFGLVIATAIISIVNRSTYSPFTPVSTRVRVNPPARMRRDAPISGSAFTASNGGVKMAPAKAARPPRQPLFASTKSSMA